MFNKYELTQAIKDKARQLGFTLAGVTSFAPPAHFDIFETWLAAKHHATMEYLASERSRLRRADPSLILPEGKSILVLALPYDRQAEGGMQKAEFKVAAYALGNDYHEVILPKLKEIVQFIEEQVGHPVPSRYYTDTGPILERELAQRAGLGWIGKNSMLIHPTAGSTFLLAEILLGIEMEFDEPFQTDHCGTCTRCIEACPTQCILPNRTINSNLCISYLTIENKGGIPEPLRPLIQNWIFGCDICQQVCPWNRFAPPANPALEPAIPLPILTDDLTLTSPQFNQRFKHSPIQRAKRRGYLRNLATAVGNTGSACDIPILEQAAQDEPLIREHAVWAIQNIKEKQKRL
ncbi:MAG: tRNA epoxyqueuosine(34) reductase QueG [Chloroflexi bacterium]|nr:tRNA epoxyqueuosine(34) reductase QueG [Chloroflexota bacterium]